MKMKFLGLILNKTKKDRIGNTKIRLELEVDEIKNIQKSRWRWFGHLMQMGVERVPNKMPHTNGRQMTKKKTQKQIDKIRKDLEMRDENRKEMPENRENRNGWKFLFNRAPISLETS